MPELPEVEFARGVLERALRGAVVDAVRVYDARIVRPSARALSAIAGARVEAIERRGKWLRVALDDARRLFAHLGMTGKWIAEPPDEPTARFERVRLEVTRRGRHLTARYVDMRMFGRVIVARDDVASWTALGPDPLRDGIAVARLHAALARRRRAVKEVLMDQAVLAGIGNIQATEALWRARVDPRTRSDALSRADVRRIARGVDDAIAHTRKHQETESITYVEEPGAPNPFVVYGRKGQPCPRCGTPLEKIVLGGRGTTFCPRCQAPRAR